MNTPTITPIDHASFTLKWGDVSIAVDPVGSASRYGHPSLILVTDIHSDHLDPATLTALEGHIIAPKAVADELSDLAHRTTVLKNDETCDIFGFSVSATPMYNIPGSDNEQYHPRGRGNGYIIDKNGVRIYVAGDTAGIPEMSTYRDIAIAFLPMNLPYTMGVEEAVGATLALKPKVAIPYHYRGPEGLSDVAHYKDLVEKANIGTTVQLLKWYS